MAWCSGAWLTGQSPGSAKPPGRGSGWQLTGPGGTVRSELLARDCRLAPNGIKIMLRRLGEKAGIERLHAHRRRHSYAPEWKRAGEDTGDLMLVLGWTSDAMPRHYGRSALPNVHWRPSSGSASASKSDR